MTTGTCGGPRIAISAARLEHVTRGVETWARATFEALRARGVDVTLYKGSGESRPPAERVLRAIRKGSRLSRALVAAAPRFGWRIGLGSGDQLEETTFGLRLLREAWRRKFDIIHMQDAHVANLLRGASERGWIPSKIILGHGTEEPIEFLSRFRYLQHLAPYHRDEALAALRAGSGMPAADRPGWVAIPNFVDTDRFRPAANPAEKARCRAALDIPAEAFVVLSVAAIKRHHKRIDYLIREIAGLNLPSVFLVVAGAREADTDELIEMAAQHMGHRVKFLCDLPHDRMPEVLRAADLFALCSLKEMMPIALLEAIASGLPALVHRYPVEAWMIGEGGRAIDMARDGALADAVRDFMREDLRVDASRQARQHAVNTFARDVVVDQMMDFYRKVLAS